MSVNVEIPDKVSVEEASRFLSDPNYCLQEKRNGKHRLLIRHAPVATGARVDCFNRTGEQRGLATAFTTALLNSAFPAAFALDVEQEKNEIQILDLLMVGDRSLVNDPYSRRLQLAESLFSNRHPRVQVIKSFYGENKLKVLKAMLDENAEGVVFKKLDARYREGRAGQHKALKFWKTLDAVVIEKNREGKDAVELGLFKDGQVFRICGSSLIGKVKIEPGMVVEIKFLYGTPDLHVVQPTILRVRDDKRPEECTMGQLTPHINKNWSQNG